MMRVLPVNLTTILVELPGLEETLALLTSLQSQPVDGIKEMIPAARTLLVHFDPESVSAKALATEFHKRDLSAISPRSDCQIEIPVRYDGVDLDNIAKLTGHGVEEIIRRHKESQFTVAFCGFAPGFSYLTGGDPALFVPRHQTPRTRIPAGSVALAGAFSGIYPQSTPGGWQLIGSTSVKMWDTNRSPSALLQPGYQVKFVEVDDLEAAEADATLLIEEGATAGSGPNDTEEEKLALSETVGNTNPHFKVLTAPMPALFQDLGRPGQANQGVSASGVLDRSAFRAANRTVGNPAGTGCLELTLGGFSFESTSQAVIGCTGAPCPITIQDAKGQTTQITETHRPIALEPGDVVTFGHPRTGMRTYVAVRGGFEINPILGSVSTDTLAAVGPSPVVAGSRLILKNAQLGLTSVSIYEAPAFTLPAPGDVVILDVVLGPRTDWFTKEGLETLTQQCWKVTAESSRAGVRLSGNVSIERKDDKAELPSEGTVTGAIQVPHNGQPVLFLADHPLTGGYPVIGAVADYHLDLTGQLPVNTMVQFRAITPWSEIQPQHNQLHAS
ncbi:allophanate hydrolase subunit 2-domain-containing protein [Aspergillus pseudotamarii]|uniref:Allophanate hydrolase subunit 2-domain-containing protein n=1 Tax=Aspergillus pseudotamarii TaxID=132259 RepID=A0A5N6T9B3_ASPPS|nr:allophanate hydrolase subunit 2-domain-containing protein [Aspergillus pseudotamarii]KAE8142903.1 allophanate hydrolase subunit 2-domain-containing protein [Aspergillus pseudotamarii]